ncbi:hypothetical protein AB0H36_06385 [Kribbella sp. NPDC050820]|uniref:hypothetical protein n=1 Tax=Kribbella sp. NPDC050820 TaxID=3155408 RepID=UPI0033F2EC4E
MVDLGFVQGTVIADLAWDTVGVRLGVLSKSSGRDIIHSFNALDVLGGGQVDLGAGIYNTTTETFADLTWQGRNVVIGDTPATTGPDVSIPFDRSALIGEFVQCYLDGEYLGSCTSPFTATGLSSGRHTLQIQTTNLGSGPYGYSGYATRTFTVQ